MCCLEAGNGAADIIYTVGPWASPDLFMDLVLSKRPVEAGVVSRETWRRFLNPAGWVKGGKLVEHVGSREWHKIPKPDDAKSAIKYCPVRAPAHLLLDARLSAAHANY